MKKKISYFSSSLFILTISFLFNVACSSKPDVEVTPLPTPSITSISPESGIIGTMVTIVGENFGETSNEVKIAFGATNANISSFSKNKIKVIAPTGATGSKVNVTVTSGDKTSNVKEFLYTELTPTITSLSPANGEPDTEVTIAGENFGNKITDVKVAFGTTDAKVISVSAESIRVKAPAGESNTTVNVTVSVGDKVSNKMEFYYNKKVPAITSMTKNSFYTSTVVITGINFSPDKDQNIVKFGTKEATVTEATSTSLSVTSPDLGDATTAEITVTVEDVISNAKSILINADQSKINRFDWETLNVRPGITYKKGIFTLFGSAQRRIYILDVTLNSSNTLAIGVSDDAKVPIITTTMSKNYNAIVGINAGYFPSGGTALKDPYIRINGVTIQMGDAATSYKFSNSALIINKNVAKVRKFSEVVTNLNQIAAAIPVSEAENMILCGPILITNNEIESQDDSSHNTSKTARTGLGVTADGKRVFMVVVDSGAGYTGVTTTELAVILQALGAVDAMNFDGGGSSTMYIKDQGDNGLMNFPYGVSTQRAVRSIIYVK